MTDKLKVLATFLRQVGIEVTSAPGSSHKNRLVRMINLSLTGQQPPGDQEEVAAALNQLPQANPAVTNLNDDKATEADEDLSLPPIQTGFTTRDQWDEIVRKAVAAVESGWGKRTLIGTDCTDHDD